MRYRVVARCGVGLGLIAAGGCTQLVRQESPYLTQRLAEGPLPQRLDSTMESFARQGFSGAVLVAVGTRVLLYRGYGDANRARELPNTAETKYPLGALANAFTAVAVLHLESDGRLSTSDPASRYLGPAAPPLTLEQLLTRSGEAGEMLFRPASAGPEYLLPAAERFKTPGPSYQALNQILQQVTGDSLYRLLRDRVLLPNGLTRTLWDDGRLGDSLVARGYAGDTGTTVLARGLVAPLADLWRWHNALQAGRVLTVAQRDRMFRPAADGYGFGWVVGTTAGGEQVIEQSSDEAGFQLWSAYFPRRDCLILLAVNNDLGWRQPVSERLAELMAEGATGGLAIVP
jgi:CubicO group peptidase (beta-lactamase class C family)